MRTVTALALAASVVGALFTGSAHSQSPGDGSSHEQTLVPRGNEKPSFDCAKAKTATARLICADGELARLDGVRKDRWVVGAIILGDDKNGAR